MTHLYRTWDSMGRTGNLIMLAYLVTQFLDGAFTYMGLSIWGLASWRKLQLEAERPPCITGRTRRSRG